MERHSIDRKRTTAPANGRSLDRRRFVELAGAIGVAGLAGCVGDEPDEESNGAEDGGDGSEGEEPNGGEDGGDGGAEGGESDAGGGNGGGPYTLTVAVEDGAGEPIPGARVEVDPFDEPDETAGSDGRIAFELQNGEYLVEAEAAGFESAETTVTIDGADEAVTLTLPADG